VSGFLGFEIDKDAGLAIITPLPWPTPTDGLLARGVRRDIEGLGKLAVGQPSFSHRQSPYRCLFALYDQAVNEWLFAFWVTFAFGEPVLPRTHFERPIEASTA
jgi:hypothetical protein